MEITSTKTSMLVKRHESKRAAYISINCELQQEFMFAHPKKRFETNLTFNYHFTGSPTWDLLSAAAVQLECFFPENIWPAILDTLLSGGTSLWPYLSQDNAFEKIPFIHKSNKQIKREPSHFLIVSITRSRAGKLACSLCSRLRPMQLQRELVVLCDSLRGWKGSQMHGERLYRWKLGGSFMLHG